MPLADLTITPQVTLCVCQCFDCGRWYAVERAKSARCPYCAAEDVRRAVQAQQTAERSAAATRGALNRLKARRKRP
jgi:hypothetical protein